jgi:hypothetical protein
MVPTYLGQSESLRYVPHRVFHRLVDLTLGDKMRRDSYALGVSNKSKHTVPPDSLRELPSCTPGVRNDCELVGAS